jgi:hypothetical protein
VVEVDMYWGKVTRHQDMIKDMKIR